MNLEQQVCSLELAKKLKELGVKQNALFTWIKNFHTNDPWKVGSSIDLGNNQDAINRNLEPWFTVGPGAFTVAELGEMLNKLDLKYHEIDICLAVATDWSLDLIERGEYGPDGDTSRYHADADTEADARALMLIYLVENKLIDHATLQ